jgi:hypothetical protein
MIPDVANIVLSYESHGPNPTREMMESVRAELVLEDLE